MKTMDHIITALFLKAFSQETQETLNPFKVLRLSLEIYPQMWRAGTRNANTKIDNFLKNKVKNTQEY
jgi:hypothetical protein